MPGTLCPKVSPAKRERSGYPGRAHAVRCAVPASRQIRPPLVRLRNDFCAFLLILDRSDLVGDVSLEQFLKLFLFFL